jgi:hypothetical protein
VRTVSENCPTQADRDLADWKVTGKYPEGMKGPLRLAATAAMRHQMFGQREEGKSFYTALSGALPFNPYTLTVSRSLT